MHIDGFRTSYRSSTVGMLKICSGKSGSALDNQGPQSKDCAAKSKFRSQTDGCPEAKIFKWIMNDMVNSY